MTKHIFGEVLVWDVSGDFEVYKHLCEKCRQKDNGRECLPMKDIFEDYNPKYIDKALKALASTS